MLKILVTGGTGMLGSILKEHLPQADFLNGKSELDLSYPEVWDVIKLMNHYDVIIHTAAITNLNICEQHVPQAYHLHSDVIKLLQKKCDKLVYISAQGKEYDNVYFKSKLKGEQLTLQRPNDLVIRTNIYGNGGLVNWAIEELSNNKKINGYTDVMFNPLSTLQLSKVIINSFDESGIINTGTRSTISKYDFLKILALKNNLDINLISPTKNNIFQDLTVNRKGQYREFNLIDGILEL